MVGSRSRKPSYHHVGVTDRLDLLESSGYSEIVEGDEHVVEKSDERLSFEFLGKRCEPDDVGEQNGDLG
jgi:hypothetical protein